MPVPKNKMLMALFSWHNPFFIQMVQTYQNTALQEIKKQNYDILKRVDFVSEINWLLKVIEGLDNCPIVFSHNDFNKKNILVKETEGSEDIQIFLIDFDWSSYNYRGVDLGQYFSSWAQIEPDFGSGEFPTDEQMLPFIDAYIEEMSQILGDSYAKQEINSRKQLIKEAKIFSLLSFMKDYMYFIFQIGKGIDILASTVYYT